MIATASNSLAQAAAVDQAVEAEAVVVAGAVMVIMESKTGPDAALSRTERFLISRNNLMGNPRAPSTTSTQGSRTT